MLRNYIDHSTVPHILHVPCLPGLKVDFAARKRHGRLTMVLTCCSKITKFCKLTFLSVYFLSIYNKREYYFLHVKNDPQEENKI